MKATTREVSLQCKNQMHVAYAEAMAEIAKLSQSIQNAPQPGETNWCQVSELQYVVIKLKELNEFYVR